jgi:hypothetical protein
VAHQWFIENIRSFTTPVGRPHNYRDMYLRFCIQINVSLLNSFPWLHGIHCSVHHGGEGDSLNVGTAVCTRMLQHLQPLAYYMSKHQRLKLHQGRENLRSKIPSITLYCDPLWTWLYLTSNLGGVFENIRTLFYIACIVLSYVWFGFLILL